MKAEDLRRKSIEKLEKIEKDLVFELIRSSIKGKHENIKTMKGETGIQNPRKIKRMIARVKTIIREKEVEENA